MAFTFCLGCSESYVPKPLGFHRIELSKKEYELFETQCKFNFQKSKIVDVLEGKENCWMNLYYPKHQATIYLTYKVLENDLSKVLEESHQLVYDHSDKSDGIIEKSFINKEEKVFGVMFDIYGNSASNLQFFATDSVKHFIRGALYFNNTPNSDSIQPVKEYIKKDLQILMESLSWS